MKRSEALDALLWNIRQHPALQELLAAVERPRVSRYRPSANVRLDELGAKTSYESGQIAQDNRWRSLLTGDDYEPKE